MSEPRSILERIEADQIRIVDFRFTDLSGSWRHIARNAAAVTEHCLADGIMIDGSAVPGWRDVTEADLLLHPDLESAFLDPFAAQPTLALVCNGADPATGTGYERDPRSAAQRAETYLASLRKADSVRVAIELAFYLFDELRAEVAPHRTSVELVPLEPRRQTAGPGLSGGYLASSPADQATDIRGEIATVLASIGLVDLRFEHGRGAGQNVIHLPAASLVRSADAVQTVRYAVHQVAMSYGKAATFLPKPMQGRPASGCAVLQSLWRDGKPVFAGQGYADLSPLCLAFIAGVLAHGRALGAFTNPSTNSYRRLRQDEEEPTVLAYAAHNRSAAIRIPYASRVEGKRIEARFPDATANPYLAFAALLMAGMDGIERKLEPGDAIDRNLYDLRPEEAADLVRLPRSLPDALDALEADHDFLTRGDVMPTDLIEAYLQVKRQELDRVERAPHPIEFELYAGY
ncbi:MAG: type I glutamate--ammonia ligase [Geminicoccaceae bacterium]